MKKYLLLCLGIISIGLFASCRTQKAVVATFSDLDGEWNIIELNGNKLDTADSPQFIAFDTVRQLVSGNAGCNRMTGKMEYSDTHKNIVKFPQIATTRMACPDMRGEQELLQTLDKVVRFAAVGENKPVTEIAFYGTDNGRLIVIEKKK